MASVPAETNASDLPAGSESDSPETGNKMLLGFNRLNLLRQIGLMVGLAASVALGVAVVLWAQEPNYQPVVGDLSNYNPQDVASILDSNGIEYKMDPRSGALLVPSDKVYDARMKLAAEGVTDRKTIGFELLDKDRGLGTSQFMETVSYRRGLEGELARTIASMRGVKNARVHLAIPERSVFIRDAREPSASVFLDLFAGRRPEQEQIRAIVNLVAGSIPMMKREQVTVVDHNGNLLTGNEPKAEVDRMKDQYEYTAQVEERLSRRVASLVSPIIGDGRYRAEVTADLDFSAVERAEELFNPDQQAVRSERELVDQRGGNAQGGVPGALSNQPPGAATVPEQAGQGEEGEGGNAEPVNVRRESTRNYEVDRTVSYTRQELGAINRVTVALAVDDKRVVDPETGAVSFEPWTEQELQRLSMLVRDAVGYSAARGDSVTVMNTAFAPEETVEYEEPGFWEQPWFWDLMKQVLAGLVILILVLGLLRPTLKALSGGGRAGKEGESEDDYGSLEGIEGGDALRDAMSSQDDLLLPGATEGYDRHLNALKGLIADDPARVSQVLRQWVNVDD